MTRTDGENDGAGDDQLKVSEAMEERDEAVLERSAAAEIPATDMQSPSMAEAEASVPGDATMLSPDIPVDPLMEDIPVGDDAVMSDREMLDVAPAAPVESAPASTAGRAPVDYKAYEVWFSRNGLDLSREGMLDEDPDMDGYANRDEFLSDTDPNDAASHPGFHPQMRLKEMNVVEAPVLLESVSGSEATVRNTQTGETSKVTTGGEIPGTKLKVAKVQRRVKTDKFGMEDDVSQLTVVNESTGEETTLIRDMPARTSSTSAILVSETDPSQTVTVRQGEEFEFPGEPGKTYIVIDMRETQIVVRNLDTGETWTIPKR